MDERLESYFDKYPDEPRETILKEHLLSLGHWFSEAALNATEGAQVKSYRLFSLDLVPMTALKRGEHRRVPEHFTILGGPYQLQPVLVQTSLAPSSPYLIDVIDGRLVLTAGGRVLCDVRYPRAPDYYSKTLPNGTPYHEIVANGYFVTLFRNCQYWGTSEECKFCDINVNVREMKRSQDFTLTAPVKPIEDVVRVVDEIGQQAKKYPGTHRVLISGGTITKTLHGKTESEFYGGYIQALKKLSPSPKILFEVNARPRDELKFYKSIGVNVVNLNMEVWQKHLFEWINPGKTQRVGWQNWVDWMCNDAVEIFGEGAVTTSLVSGIELARPHGYRSIEEAVDSTAEGFEYMMSRGVLPRPQQWRREPGTALCSEAEQPPVPLDFYVLLTRRYYQTYKKYRAKVPMRRRAVGLFAERDLLGAVHGTYQDYIFLKESSYPPNIVELINQRSLPYENLPH